MRLLGSQRRNFYVVSNVCWQLTSIKQFRNHVKKKKEKVITQVIHRTERLRRDFLRCSFHKNILFCNILSKFRQKEEKTGRGIRDISCYCYLNNESDKIHESLVCRFILWLYSSFSLVWSKGVWITRQCLKSFCVLLFACRLTLSALTFSRVFLGVNAVEKTCT